MAGSTLDSITALLGGPITVNDTAIDNVLRKTKIAEAQNLSGALWLVELTKIKRDLLFIKGHRRSQLRALNSAIQSARKLKNHLLSGKIILFEGEPAEYTACLVETLDFFLWVAERDFRADTQQAEILREIISGSIAHAFVSGFARAPGVSIIGDQPSGPFVRFVRAIFDEFAPELTPISGHTIRQAAEEWKRNASASKLK